MGLRDRISGFLSPQTHQDHAPAQQSQTAAPATQAGQVEVTSRADAEARWDSSMLNSITQLGSLTADKGTAARPQQPTPLSANELSLLYEHNGIARRIVDILPFEGTRKGWTIKDDTSEGNPFQELNRTLNVREVVREGWIWGRLYGSGVVLMVTDDGKPLSEPLDLEKPGKLHALHAYDGVDAVPVKWEGNIRMPGYRGPEMWSLRSSSAGWGRNQVDTNRVHASRVLWFRGARRPTHRRLLGAAGLTGQDQSVLQAMWDEVRNMTSMGQAGATLAQEIRETILKLEDFGARMTGDQSVLIESRVRLMARVRSLMGITILSKGEELESRANPPTGFMELSKEARTLLAAVTGYPQVVLFGDTPSGMNTDGESAWTQMNRLTSASQEDVLRSRLEYFYTVANASLGRDPGSWKLAFNPLDEPSEMEKEQTRLLVAQRDAIYVGSAVITPDRVERSRFGEDGWQDELLPPDEEADEAGKGVLLEALKEEMAAGNSEGPQQTAPTEAAEGKLSDMALNGAQIKSALDIVKEVAAGELPRDTGISMLAEFFQQLTPQQVERIMGSVGRSFTPASAKQDADEDSWWIGIMLPPAAAQEVLKIGEEVERAIGPMLVDNEPHITVLYLGKGLEPEAEDEIREAMEELSCQLPPVEGWTATSFPHGADGTPVVLRVQGWALEELHNKLLRRLAHLIRSRQWDEYRPHITLGYAAGELTDAQREAVARTSFECIQVPTLSLELRRGGKVLSRVRFDAEKEGE